MSADWSQESGTPRQRRGPYVKGRSARGAQRHSSSYRPRNVSSYHTSHRAVMIHLLRLLED